MGCSRSLRYFFVLALVFAFAGLARAAALRSTSRNQRSAVMEYGGFFLAPVGAEPQGPGDLAPPQLFELVRPGDQAIQLGRLNTSCVCVTLEADKTYYAAGEKAVLRMRNVRLTPPQGQMYAVYVQVTSPVRTILRADTFVQSAEFIPSKPGEAPTRGDIVADGVLETPAAAAASASDKIFGEDGVEIIVPKADVAEPEPTPQPAPEAEASEPAAPAAAPEENGEEPIVSEVVVVDVPQISE